MLRARWRRRRRRRRRRRADIAETSVGV